MADDLPSHQRIVLESMGDSALATWQMVPWGGILGSQVPSHPCPLCGEDAWADLCLTCGEAQLLRSSMVGLDLAIDDLRDIAEAA